jgi:hypothetical protein
VHRFKSLQTHQRFKTVQSTVPPGSTRFEWLQRGSSALRTALKKVLGSTFRGCQAARPIQDPHRIYSTKTSKRIGDLIRSAAERRVSRTNDYK